MRLGRLPVVLVVGYWAVIVAPYVAVGPNDLEEFYTGILGTKLAVQAILSGHWPFWSLDIGLGVPLPLKYHFVTHPASLLCALDDCQRAMRVLASIQILIGALCMALILRADGIGRWMATVGALAYLLTSSTIEDTYVNDWSSTAFNESSIPILIYAAMQLFRAGERSGRLLWSLVLGGTIGVLFSMGYAGPQLIVAGLFFVARPRLLWERRGWLALGAGIALCIGGAHVYHLAEQMLRTPPGVQRADHVEPSLAVYAWSTFVRPFGEALDRSWRIVFLGPPFAVLACLSLLRPRRALWPYQFGLVASILLIVLPEAWLFNLVTARWFFRAGVNIYGVLLACHLLSRVSLWRAGTARTAASVAVACVVVAQLAWQWAAFLPLWRAVAVVAMGGAEADPQIRRVAADRPAVTRLQALTAATPGRLVYSAEGHRRVRTLRLARYGLAPNVFPMGHVPTVNAVAHGITVDALYPTQQLTGGPLLPPEGVQADQAFLDVLGIRYVLVLPGEPTAARLRAIGPLPEGFLLYENPDAWPEAFAVSALPTARVPRKDGCEHDRFYCADFSRYPIGRLDTPVRIERHADGMTLTLPESGQPQHVVVTQWYQPGWHVSGGAEVGPAMEQLVGITLPPGQRTATLTYFPVVRGSLFLFGVAVEVAVAAACVWLARRRVRP